MTLTLTEEEIFHNRILGIIIAVITALVSSVRPVQAKWVSMKFNYHPFDFTVDSGLLTGTMLFPFWLYYLLTGHHAYTWSNTLYSFFASIFIMFWGLVGLYAQVKGPQGPTTAIMQTHSIFSIGMGAMFFGFIPNMQ
jgi:hypothetical protein